ncbi:F0F1 ATP synthase subunit delta [Candidatus Profftia tarda]|nr:F0F1 ATP synthase subunit delta [Candidatus Profftia tarda]
MSALITVARPYARAAFNFAVEHQNLNSWQQMLFFCSEVTREKNVAHILARTLTTGKLSDFFIKLCGDQLDKFGHNFIKIMSEQRRLMLLPEVFRQFNILRDVFEDTIKIEVISVSTLSAKQISKIKEAMERRLSSRVKINCKIDESIIAGVIIRIGDLVIDGSIRNRLQLLADYLQY